MLHTSKVMTRMIYALGILLALASYRATAALPDFTEHVEEYSPAVVNISGIQAVKPRQMPPNMRDMPNIPEGPFGDLFRRFFDDQGKRRPEQNAQSLGSGFIISKDGYVITNHHVVKDSSEVIVRLNDRRQFVAKLVGSDEQTDIALLKIEANDLPVVKLNRKKALKPGEWVMAIGSPFGFETSVTVGVVSATERSLPRENYVPFIQTDVAINPGNSGGPLFDLDGNVVGVNSQIYSRTGGFMGLSFSIPVEIALNVAEQIKANGKVSRGWLGVMIQDVTRELAESMQMKRAMGALVSRVLPDSPAEKAGIKVGDVIIEFNGKEISTSSTLPPMVGLAAIGKKHEMKLIRDGKTMTVSVMVGQLPDEDAAVKVSEQGGQAGKGGRLGLAVSDLNDEQRRRMNVEKGGVMVVEVVDGAAQSAGLRRGDVILMMDNKEVVNASQFVTQARSLPAGKTVRVLIQRGDGPAFVALKVPEDKK